MTIHEYPTGTPVWTWRVPEKWTCEEAYLETLDGRRLLDYADHPLHVVSYSLPFEGVVSREELLAHLHVHPRLPEAIPFVFKYYERDWGLCASQTLRDSLTEPEYRVVIRTRFEPGTLKVGEILIPGETEETFVLAAHLCHPHMVNDDLTGVAVLMGVAEALLSSHSAPRTSHIAPPLHLPPPDCPRNHRLGGLPESQRRPDTEDGRRAVPGDAGQRFAPRLARFVLRRYAGG